MLKGNTTGCEYLMNKKIVGVIGIIIGLILGGCAGFGVVANIYFIGMTYPIGVYMVVMSFLFFVIGLVLIWYGYKAIKKHSAV